MKAIRKVLFTKLLIILTLPVIGQNLNQTIKGTVIDQESQMPLPGAVVIIEDVNPQLFTTTETDGSFKIIDVPVGRHTLTVSFIGYTKSSIPELLLGSGKEVVLNISLKEEVTTIKEVVVKANKNKDQALNSMATISARSFNIEETKRYAGGLDDPARLVAAFAGVNSGSIESNAIMVRGNAPSGIIWQINGVVIPNPSHFSGADMLGGGFVTMFSNQLLSNSDFFTGAFPAEYGNALAGVFDMKLRNGNNEKHEHAFQIGVMGIDFSSEWPFKQGGKSSYLFNY
jgi:hypothetical protein